MKRSPEISMQLAKRLGTFTDAHGNCLRIELQVCEARELGLHACTLAWPDSKLHGPRSNRSIAACPKRAARTIWYLDAHSRYVHLLLQHSLLHPPKGMRCFAAKIKERTLHIGMFSLT